MFSKTFSLSILLAFTEARFGQEQVPAAAIQALGAFGSAGDAATLAGKVPGTLLGGADACAQVLLADEIVGTLGNSEQVISAARLLVGAEKNFNPFAVDIPSLCGDAGLPATAALRGVIPIVDPAVVGSDVQNANAAASLTTPLANDGLSIADISAAGGFSNFNVDGAAAASNNGNNNSSNNNGNGIQGCKGNVNGSSIKAQTNGRKNKNKGNGNNDGNNGDALPAFESNGVPGDGFTTSTIADAEFGFCIPTLSVLDNGDFQVRDGSIIDQVIADADPGVAAQSACDILGSVCRGNQAAVDACNAGVVLVAGKVGGGQAAADEFDISIGFGGNVRLRNIN